MMTFATRKISYSTVMDVTSRMNILKLIFALEIFDHTS